MFNQVNLQFYLDRGPEAHAYAEPVRYFKTGKTVMASFKITVPSPNKKYLHFWVVAYGPNADFVRRFIETRKGEAFLLTGRLNENRFQHEGRWTSRVEVVAEHFSFCSAPPAAMVSEGPAEEPAEGSAEERTDGPKGPTVVETPESPVDPVDLGDPEGEDLPWNR